MIFRGISLPVCIVGKARKSPKRLNHCLNAKVFNILITHICLLHLLIQPICPLCWSYDSFLNGYLSDSGSYGYDAFGCYSYGLTNSRYMSSLQLAQLIAAPNVIFLILPIERVISSSFKEALSLENYSYLLTW